MNVSSIVVQARSEHIDDLVKFFKSCDFCDYHFHDKAIGKIILTVEGEDVSEEIGKLKRIQVTHRVISADMMMAYSEDELDREREKIAIRSAENPVPAMLNDENMRAEDISYYGDLKKKKI